MLVDSDRNSHVSEYKVACPFCDMPKFFRCVTVSGKYVTWPTQTHRARVNAWKEWKKQEEQKREEKRLKVNSGLQRWLRGEI